MEPINALAGITSIFKNSSYLSDYSTIWDLLKILYLRSRSNLIKCV